MREGGYRNEGRGLGMKEMGNRNEGFRLVMRL